MGWLINCSMIEDEVSYNQSLIISKMDSEKSLNVTSIKLLTVLANSMLDKITTFKNILMFSVNNVQLQKLYWFL